MIMRNKQLLEWEEEFDDKFNHFNDAYIGHKDQQYNPNAGRQTCDPLCDKQYDLEDIKEWIKTNFISRKEMKKRLQYALDTLHGGGNGRRLMLLLLESL